MAGEGGSVQAPCKRPENAQIVHGMAGRECGAPVGGVLRRQDQVLNYHSYNAFYNKKDGYDLEWEGLWL